MSQLNFDAMSKTELRAYVIAHQDDKEAFYALVDRITADSSSSVKYPATMTLEEIDRTVLNIIEKKQQK